MSSAKEMLWSKKTRGPRTGTFQCLINKENREMLSDKLGENQERRVCWLFSISLSSLLHAVQCPWELISMSCVAQAPLPQFDVGLSQQEKREIRYMSLVPSCYAVVLRGFIFLTSTVCILAWVKKYIEEKKKSEREYVLMNLKRHFIWP